MVIDTSAVVASLIGEPDAERYEAAVAAADRRLMSTASVLAAAIVVENRFGEVAGHDLDLWLHRAHVEVVAVDRDQIDVAREAFRQYGKGRHAAGLNFGDCFSYALAKISGEPMLFKGADFIRTDIASAL